MNLTQLIEETGKRFRLGKPAAQRVTNTEIREVLEIAVEIMKEALIEEGRIEIQKFCVIEVHRTSIQSTSAAIPTTIGQRFNWIIRPTQSLRRAVIEKYHVNPA